MLRPSILLVLLACAAPACVLDITNSRSNTYQCDWVRVDLVGGHDMRTQVDGHTLESHCGTHVLRIADGKLLLDGVERGTFRDGDRVVLHASGRLLVNDIERAPAIGA